MSAYSVFLASKAALAPAIGRQIDPGDVPDLGPSLDEFNAEHELPDGWHYIYGLYDPRTYELRYVGKSDKPRQRLAGQLNEARGTHRCNWIQQLKRAGLRPLQVILDASPPGPGWEVVERAYIAGARVAGYRLTNGTDGGEGVPGLSPEVRERMRQAKIGSKASPETRAKMSAAKKGRTYHSEEWRRRVSAAATGRIVGPRQREMTRQRMQKLTPDEVREIRRRLATGESQRAIAPAFNVSVGTISNIKIGRVDGHIAQDGDS